MKYSCSVIISNFESLPFLYACVRQIKKYRHPLIEQHIFIADQSGVNTFLEIEKTYKNDNEVSVIWMAKQLYSGYGIDVCLRNRNIKTDYIAQYHCDAFPISDKHLLLPIKLIEEYNLSFVGQLQFISTGKESIYPPSPMFAMAQCYNVARTETYREMSYEAGFTRFHNRPQSGLLFNNNDWSEWAKDDYERKGSDDDIVAFSWESKHKHTDKIGLAISGYIEANFGRIIDGLVFHFGSANESKGVMDKMPELYQYYTQRINEDYSDELISEMVELAKKNKPNNSEILSRNFWNGTTKQSSPTSDELNKRIEELKQ